MKEMNRETQDTKVLVPDHALNVIIGETLLEVEAEKEDIQIEAAAGRERVTMVLIEHAG